MLFLPTNFLTDIVSFKHSLPGAHWWVGMFGEGTFSCNGYEGQFAIAVPSHSVVVVRVGKSKSDGSNQKDNLIAQLEQVVAEACAPSAVEPEAARLTGKGRSRL
jgi:hypothetical protein